MGCFFCDVQEHDEQRLADREYFFARFDDYPVSQGHCLVVPKEHIVSFFSLDASMVQELYELLDYVTGIVDKRFAPDGYNIGINEGECAGRSVHHLHVHLIPRYRGDVEDPRGGVRRVIPEKASYPRRDENV